MVYNPRDAKMNSTYQYFLSTEQTGTGGTQNIAHGLKFTPEIVIVVPSYIAMTNAATFTTGTATSTNCVVTATTGAKYYVLALTKQRVPRKAKYDGGVRFWLSGEQTGPQTVSHPFKMKPNKVLLIPSYTVAGATTTFTIASTSDTSVTTTGTTATAKYRVLCISNNVRLPRSTKDEMVKISSEITATGVAQNTAHAHKTIPSFTLVVPSYVLTASNNTFTQGTHTSTNSVVTGTNTTKYYVLTIF